MKIKQFAAVIILILVFALTANAETEKEILFRGIQWDTDIVAFSVALNNDLQEHGVDFRYSIEDSEETLVILYGYSESEPLHIDRYNPTTAYYDSVFTIDKNTFSVADVETNTIWLYAIPKVHEGKPMDGKENAGVVFAKYDMSLESYTDKNLIYDGLCEKLKQLYGEPDEAESYMMLWYGAKDTFCEIIQHNNGTIELDYGKTDLPERMIPLLNESSDIDMSNVDGL